MQRKSGSESPIKKILPKIPQHTIDWSERPYMTPISDKHLVPKYLQVREGQFRTARSEIVLKPFKPQPAEPARVSLLKPLKELQVLSKFYDKTFNQKKNKFRRNTKSKLAKESKKQDKQGGATVDPRHSRILELAKSRVEIAKSRYLAQSDVRPPRRESLEREAEKKQLLEEYDRKFFYKCWGELGEVIHMQDAQEKKKNELQAKKDSLYAPEIQ